MALPSTTDHYSKNILRALMDPSKLDTVPWSSDDLRAILEHQLSTPLSAELDAFAETGKMTTNEVMRLLGDFREKTILDAIKRASDCVGVLQMIKSMAKASLTSDGELPRDVARVLYVLTILSCRRAGVSDVTTLDDASLERETRRCLTFGWLPDQVLCLLRA